MIALAAALAVAVQAPELPRLPPIRRDPQITFLDRSGAIIGVRGGQFGPPVDVAKLPPHVAAAVVSVEDRRFYEHSGFDARGIARAIVDGIAAGRPTQGASTITQQTARLLFLTQERTLERKATELAYSIQLEQTYSKAQILGMYLSRANFGSGAYGLEAAARRYFNKPAAKLTLKEAAMLAGVLKSPTHYNPVTEPEACDERARVVLNTMVETGSITAAQRDKAAAQKPKVWATSPTAPAQYFVDWIDGQVRQMVPKPTADLTVETTLDGPMEQAAGAAAKAVVDAHKAQLTDQAAVVAVDGEGRVRTMVGGTDYVTAPYNRAVLARRQAGSAWKPFVYLTALEQGLTPDSPVVDEPVTINGWSPHNYEDGVYLGPISLQTAMMKSINTVAARLADEVGRDAVAETAHRAGIQSTINTDPAMALGTTLVTPLEMTAAYAAFANGGERVQPYGIERIRVGGRVIYRKTPPKPAPAIGNPALGELHQMMRAVMTGGTGVRAAVKGYDLAGKTGTTSDYKDAWFCGYTGDFASCVWMGRDDARPMVRITGSTAPSEMWNRFMSVALKRAGARPIPPGPPAPEPPPTDAPAVEPPRTEVAPEPAAAEPAAARPESPPF
ncbi:MAG: PBP1A family penicillin-binding protein [Phenylobacterium sp.]|uniref:transglycosylase domain-containing protein n=1 Tax=Phenylobacterium sp. TaxID=1871053 RepID=UPI0025DCDB36|nr:PBP1A family penicillin-binding protein [Phenylobacterium sp.]MBI1196372.1 PBP1A family penicillin-binding protein [Phenylobacterium sp.]